MNKIEWILEIRKVAERATGLTFPDELILEATQQFDFQVQFDTNCEVCKLPDLMAASHVLKNKPVLVEVDGFNLNNGGAFYLNQAQLNTLNHDRWPDKLPLILNSSTTPESLDFYENATAADSVKIVGWTRMENNKDTAYAVIKEAHVALIRQAIASGDLEVVPVSGLPAQRAEELKSSGDLSQISRWTISEASLQAYLNLLRGCWSIQKPKRVPSASGQPTLTIKSRDNTTTSESKTVSRARTDSLSAVIKIAQRKSSDPFDVHGVWTKLCDAAESSTPESPLIELHDKKILYRFNSENRSLTKKNLGDRLRREKARNSQH